MSTQCEDGLSKCDSATYGHRCTNVPGGYKCLCAEGFVNYDDKNCIRSQEVVQPMMLHCFGNAVWFHGKSLPHKAIVEHADQAIDLREEWGLSCRVDGNWRKNYVIYAIGRNRKFKIFKAKLFADKATTLFDLQDKDVHKNVPVHIATVDGTVRDIKVDWIHDLVFVISDTIDVISVNQPQVRFRIFENAGNDFIRNVAINPGDGVLYVNDGYKIWTVSMDGKSVTTLVQLRGDASMNHDDRFETITVDMVNSRIYVAKKYFKKIIGYDLNGNFVHDVELRDSYINDQCDVLQNFGEYLIVEKRLMLYTVNKFDKFGRPRLWGKSGCGKIVHPIMQPIFRNRCDQIRCNGLCLPNANGATCVDVRLERDDIVCHVAGY